MQRSENRAVHIPPGPQDGASVCFVRQPAWTGQTWADGQTEEPAGPSAEIPSGEDEIRASPSDSHHRTPENIRGSYPRGRESQEKQNITQRCLSLPALPTTWETHSSAPFRPEANPTKYGEMASVGGAQTWQTPPQPNEKESSTCQVSLEDTQRTQHLFWGRSSPKYTRRTSILEEQRAKAKGTNFKKFSARS